MASSNGRHVWIGEEIEDGVYEATSYDANGSVSTGTARSPRAMKGRASSGRTLEPCLGAGDRPIMHEVENGRGPAMVNSAAYCEGYERIFGDRPSN